MKKTIALFLALAGLVAVAAPAQALEAGQVLTTAYVEAVGATTIPVGHANFCAQQPHECQANIGGSDRLELTPALWNDLQLVNNTINAAIIPANDIDLYGIEEFWTVPVNGYGDCEDFVLAKRAALIEMGWDARVLLITVVRQPNGEGHAVLTVRTDRGDLILDNQEGLIQVWNQTPYIFIKRQAQHHAGLWVDLQDPRAQILLASR